MVYLAIVNTEFCTLFILSFSLCPLFFTHFGDTQEAGFGPGIYLTIDNTDFHSLFFFLLFSLSPCSLLFTHLGNTQKMILVQAACLRHQGCRLHKWMVIVNTDKYHKANIILKKYFHFKRAAQIFKWLSPKLNHQKNVFSVFSPFVFVYGKNNSQ